MHQAELEDGGARLRGRRGAHAAAVRRHALGARAHAEGLPEPHAVRRPLRAVRAAPAQAARRARPASLLQSALLSSRIPILVTRTNT